MILCYWKTFSVPNFKCRFGCLSASFALSHAGFGDFSAGFAGKKDEKKGKVERSKILGKALRAIS